MSAFYKLQYQLQYQVYTFVIAPASQKLVVNPIIPGPGWDESFEEDPI
jgi:hypothetical protein